MLQSEENYAVPRLYKLGYLEVALTEIAREASFERIRQALLNFARKAGEGNTGGIVSRLRDDYTFWSPTQEALSELMMTGLVVQAAVPSSRQYVDAHRANTYELTTKGANAAHLLSKGGGEARANFLDMLTVALWETHQGFAQLVTAAKEHPFCIPEYSIEKIATLVGENAATQRLAEDAISRMMVHWPHELPQPSFLELSAAIQRALDRRFPIDRVRHPSQKDILDTVDDAVLGFALKALNIPLDAISYNVCMSWAGQLAILEESRYVEDWPGRTVWATATIRDHAVLRRGFKEAGETVVIELKNGFRKVAESMSEGRASGYLPIHRVRAQAAFAAGVNLKLVDMILRRLISGEIKASYQVQVALGGGTPPPRSEPVFTHDGRRFFDIMITEQGGML
jgi:hypothetical protein